MKVGRNDPCPCGSGKKYKKCCWAKDDEARAQAARASTPSWSDGLLGMASDGMGMVHVAALAERTLDVLGDQSGRKAVRTLGRLAKMLEPGGAFASVRFDRTLFDGVVGEQLEALGGRGGDDPQSELFARSIDRLATPAFLDEARSTIASFLRRDEGDAEEQLAASLALAALDLDHEKKTVVTRNNTALQLVFDAQVDDRLRPFAGTLQRLRSLMKKAGSGKVDMRELNRELGDLAPELTELDEKVPWLFRDMRQQASGDLAEAGAILRGREPPPIFTIDELLVLYEAVEKVNPRLEQAQIANDEAAMERAMMELMRLIEPTMEDVAPEMTERLRRKAKEARPRERETLSTIVAALEVDPTAIGFAALTNPRAVPMPRSDDERRFVEPALEGELRGAALAEYAEYLEKKGERTALRRVRALPGFPAEGRGRQSEGAETATEAAG